MEGPASHRGAFALVRVQRAAEGFGERGRRVRRAGEAGVAVGDLLGQPAGRGRDHRRGARGEGLHRDPAERLGAGGDDHPAQAGIREQARDPRGEPGQRGAFDAEAVRAGHQGPLVRARVRGLPGGGENQVRKVATAAPQNGHGVEQVVESLVRLGPAHGEQEFAGETGTGAPGPGGGPFGRGQSVTQGNQAGRGNSVVLA